MSRIFQHIEQPQMTTSTLQGAAFGGGGRGRGRTRGRHGSPNVYSNNRSNTTHTYGWRSDWSRLDNSGSKVDGCMVGAAITGIGTALASKNIPAGRNAAIVSYASCKGQQWSK